MGQCVMPQRGPRPVAPSMPGIPGRLPNNREVMVVEQRSTGLHPTRARIAGRVRVGQHQCLILQLMASPKTSPHPHKQRRK